MNNRGGIVGWIIIFLLGLVTGVVLIKKYGLF